MCFGKFKAAFTITVREIIPVVYRCSRSENPMYGVFFITNPSHEIFPCLDNTARFNGVSLYIFNHFSTILFSDSFRQRFSFHHVISISLVINSFMYNPRALKQGYRMSGGETKALFSGFCI